MTLLAILRAARTRYASGSTSGAYARDAEGRICPVAAPEACQWCPAGAIRSVTYHGHNVAGPSLLDAERALVDAMGWGQADLEELADRHCIGKGAFLAGFDLAIAVLEGAA